MISYLNKSKLKIKEKLYGEFFIDETNSGVNFKEYEEGLFKQVVLPNRFDQCNVSDFESIRRFIEYKTKKIFFLKEILEEDFMFYNEYISGEKIKLEGKFGEAKSKIAFLGGFEGETVSALVERFYNLNQIDTSEEKSLKIEPEVGVCTLEPKRQSKISFEEIKILSSSNGIAGNILEGTNSYPTNSLNNNENLYFEFYKKGTKSLDLNIELSLTREEVVNYVELSVKKKYLESNFIVREIVFIDSLGSVVSLFSLIDSNFQDLEIESYNANNKLSIALLPVKAKKVKIFLSCTQPSLIEGKNYNVIALKEICLYKRSYSESGEIQFKSLNLESSPGLILNKQIVSYPKRESLLNFENKAIFEDQDEILIGSEKIIIEKKYNSVAYKFKMSKPESLDNLYLDNESYKDVDVNVKQQRFNRDVIPNIFEIPYGSTNIEVYQPELYDKSFQARKTKRVGVTKGEVSKFILPTNLNDLKVRISKLQVYANSELCNLKTSNNLTEDLDCFSDGEHLWILDLSENKNKEIKVNLTPNETFTWRENDRIYFETKDFLDKDTATSKIISFKKELASNEESFSQDLKRIKLNKDFICNVTIENENNEDITSMYSINFKTGLLTLNEEENFTRANIRYDYFKYKEASIEKFASIEDEIIGFSIEENSLYLNKFEQRINEDYSSFKIYRELLLGEKESDVIIRRQNLINKSLILKSKNILKGSLNLSLDFFGGEKRPLEVEYIDGESEFLNLEFIEKEVPPLIQTNSLGEFKFTLRNKPSSNRNSVKIYKNNQLLDENAVSYRIEDRVITIITNERDSRGFSVSYFTENIKDSEEIFGKYSVDYLNGILFSKEEINQNSGESLSFESTCSVLESKVCKKIENWSLKDSNIHLNPSETSSSNSLIKIAWREAEINSFEELREYYSPIVYQLKYELRG